LAVLLCGEKEQRILDKRRPTSNDGLVCAASVNELHDVAVVNQAWLARESIFTNIRVRVGAVEVVQFDFCEVGPVFRCNGVLRDVGVESRIVV